MQTIKTIRNFSKGGANYAKNNGKIINETTGLDDLKVREFLKTK